MKKIKLKRWMSVILSVALVVGCIYISEPMETEAATLSKFDEITADFNPGTDIIAGDVLVSEDFSGYETGIELVDNSTWKDGNGVAYLQNHMGNWMYNAGSNEVKVSELQSEKYLFVENAGPKLGTTAIVFPSVDTSNYVVTANVRINGTYGTVGLFTNLSNPISDPATNSTKQVTLAYLEPSKNNVTMKTRYTTDGNKQSIPLSEELFDAFKTGDIVQFTACNYKGVMYFYIDNVFIGKQAHVGDQENSLCGLYVYAGSYYLKDFTISELVRDTSKDIRSQVEVIENLVDEDFSKVTESEPLPYGWRLIKGTEAKAWLWNNTSNTQAIQKVEKATNGIVLSSKVSDGALLGPSLGTSDYVMTASIQCMSSSEYIGVLSNVIDPADKSTGATKSCIQMEKKGALITQENRVGASTQPGSQSSLSTTEILDALPGEGTDLTLTIYSFKGYTYFYINDVFVKEIAQASPQLEKSLCGFYVCNTSMLIKNVRIDAIAQVGDISKKVYTTEPILEEDFSDVAIRSLPEDWTVMQDRWIWNPSNDGEDTIEVKADASNQKYLQISDGNGEVGLILPALGTSDYVMTAKLVPTSSNGSIGMLTNMKEPLQKGIGATFSVLNLKGASETTDLAKQYYKNEDKYVSDEKSVLASTSIGTLLGSGDSIELTVYSWQGYSYFYVNDCLVCYTANKNAELETSLCGLWLCGTSVKISSVTVHKIEKLGETSATQMLGAAVRYADADGVERGAASSGMRFVASVDKDSFLYNKEENVQLGMIIRSANGLNVGDNITLETEGVVDFPLDEIVSEDDKTLQYATTLMGLTDLDEYYAARAYMKVDGEYYYSNQIKRSQARLATRLASDDNMIDESIETKLTSIFNGTKGYVKADDVKTLDFTVLGDLHYKEGMYAATIEDLTTILNRADENKSRFVMHMGDFCNDYMGSVELTNAYMDSTIPTYGIYGNHELESANNSMAYVTPLLTNQAENVVWGTADGKIGDGSIGYYYFDDDEGDDASGFRIVCTDSNYSWNEASGEWQHNTTNSYGSPTGNTKSNSLGDVQLSWLENVLTDAAQRAIPCVVLSHATMSGSWEPSPDSEAVQTIFRRVNAIQEGTVLLALNGHNHQDHMKVIDDVVYIDINTVRNGFWNGNAEAHYTDDHTFDYVKYNANGSVASTEKASLNVLSGGGTTWFFEEPVSANIRISTAGYIHVDGFETTWMYGIEPDVSEGQARVPWISDYKIDFLY